jgi:hypothetical protein
MAMLALNSRPPEHNFVYFSERLDKLIISFIEQFSSDFDQSVPD